MQLIFIIFTSFFNNVYLQTTTKSASTTTATTTATAEIFSNGKPANYQENEFKIDSNLFACLLGRCHEIKSIIVYSNLSSNCFERYLPISFYMNDPNNKQVLTFGFLPEKGLKIEMNQKSTIICKKIKR
jgi:hypothetical protein